MIISGIMNMQLESSFKVHRRVSPVIFVVDFCIFSLGFILSIYCFPLALILSFDSFSSFGTFFSFYTVLGCLYFCLAVCAIGKPLVDGI